VCCISIVRFIIIIIIIITWPSSRKFNPATHHLILLLKLSYRNIILRA
jgi:hypothetical protein